MEGKLLLMLVIMLMVGCAMGTPTLHRVGDKQNWSPGVNYSEWSSREHFYVSDWLLFNFDKRYYNVLEVNKTSYETCYDKEFIDNITRGGRDVFQLTEAGPYYFLSSGGYCWNGMKVAINVEILQAPAPAPAKSSSLSNSAGCCVSLLILQLSMALAYIIFGPFV